MFTALDNLSQVGGMHMVALDSTEMWKEEAFRESFGGGEEDDPPPRCLLLSTSPLLHQLAESKRWSQVGTHRVTPKDFGQVKSFSTIVLKVSLKVVIKVLQGVHNDDEGGPEVGACGARTPARPQVG